MSVETLASGNYRVVWRDERGGKQTQWFPRGHKAEAHAFDGRMKMLKLQGGLDVFSGGRQTLAEYHDGPWTDHLGSLEPRTVQVYEQQWRNHIEPRLGKVQLRALRVARVREFYADLGRSANPPTAFKAMGVLSSMLRLAEADERIASNPCRKVTRSRPEPRKMWPLAPVTIELLRTRMDPRGAIAVSLMGYGGLPPQDVRGARWRDLSGGTLSAFRKKTKRWRDVVLLDALAQDLREWYLRQGRPHGRAFVVPALAERESSTSEPAQWSATAFHKWARRDFAGAVAELDLDYHVTPYNLRHSFASLLLHEGRAVTYVAEQMGHTVATLSEHYSHVIRELDGKPQISADRAIAEAREQVGSLRAVP